LRVVLGLFLLGAAGLKIHGLFSGSSVRDSLLSSPRLQVATIEVELLLGAWLLSGWWPVGAWTAALGFFSTVAGVSLYLALVGQTSCGCFGTVAVNPWATLGIDVTALTVLLLCPPAKDPSSASGITFSLPAFVKIATGAGLCLILTMGAWLVAFDRPIDALARLRGELLTVDPAVSDVGEATAGTARSFLVRLVNHSDQPIRVVGGTSSCACTVTSDLPMTVPPPREARSIEIRMKFSGGVGRFQHRFVLYTDADESPIVVARFAGRVVATPP
jgi:hypothetical protein